MPHRTVPTPCHSSNCGVTLKPLQVPKHLHHSDWNPNVCRTATITTVLACLYAGGSLGSWDFYLP